MSHTDSGTVRPITIVGNPVLHRPCAPVTEFGDELATLIDDMFASMYAAEGVGLAANQIGVALRVFVYDCNDDDGVQHVGHMVNPVLVEQPADRRQLDDSPEGCLSVPGPHHELARPDYAVVTGVDVKGEPITVEGTGYFARCLQHEFDHLEGRLYIDRLGKRQRKNVLAEMERMQAEKAEKAQAAAVAEAATPASTAAN
ncbi:peptide deformylase [Catenulispora pinisilvae]|uniref:peptide deformylase n=1 Tax=Catenulispora pinisilvae TaxID=2705253 RepID=UPI0018919502|nr:peptide deformylase [Catenulispora pinisilvae]